MEARAGEGGTTLTELADHLAREHGVPFRTAHAIAGQLSGLCQTGDPARLGSRLRDACHQVLGKPLAITDAELVQVLSPRHFVDVRQTAGGPSPTETSRALEQAASVLEAERAWLARTRAAAADAEERLRARSLSL
jgi:argininosuccinate lyase